MGITATGEEQEICISPEIKFSARRRQLIHCKLVRIRNSVLLFEVLEVTQF